MIVNYNRLQAQLYTKRANNTPPHHLISPPFGQPTKLDLMIPPRGIGLGGLSGLG